MLGPAITSVKKVKEPAAGIGDFAISGNVVYIDRMGTCVTNISRESFQNQLKGRTFSGIGPHRNMKKIYDRIADVPQGKLAALWNEEGMLSIAVGERRGTYWSSIQTTGMKIHDWVRIDCMTERIVKLAIDPNLNRALPFVRFLPKAKITSPDSPVATVYNCSSEGHFFTFSHWESEADLNAYRESALFGEVWPKTKALFYDKPQADVP